MSQSRTGWIVVAVGFVGLALCFADRNLLQVTMTSMEAELGWSRSLLSSGATLALVTMAAGNLFGGMLVDRYGPRSLFSLGLASLGLGMIGAGWAREPWQYIVALGVLAGLGFGLVASSIVSAAVARFFVERRGLALGVATAGGPVGQMTLIPLAAVLLTAFGWRALFVIFGLVALAVAPVAYAALRPAATGAGTAKLTLASRPPDPGTGWGRTSTRP